jgi:hypothetical protein
MGAQVRLRILQRHMVVVGSPEGLKRVFQTNQRAYVKDLDFSFHPFLPILGTGLVTAQGDLWQRQRLLMAPTLRVEVLDDVVRLGTCQRASLCFICIIMTFQCHACMHGQPLNAAPLFVWYCMPGQNSNSLPGQNGNCTMRVQPLQTLSRVRAAGGRR